jgi:hypothetical protein
MRDFCWFYYFYSSMPQPRLTRRTFYRFLKKTKERAIISSVFHSSSQKLPQDASREVLREHAYMRLCSTSGQVTSSKLVT